MSKILTVLIAICIALSVSAVCADDASDQPNKFVEPTHDGNVIGRVYDAASGEPVSKALVVIEDSGKFTESNGKLTNETGLYTCVAKIGRISSKINVGRVLGSSILGLLSGSAKDTTKRIDISRLNIRVTCDGYNTFEGIVPIRVIDSNLFVAEMQPILLTKTGSAEVSTSAPGWGAAGIVDVALSPSIARPGSTVSLVIKVKCPQVAVNKRTTIELMSTAFANKRLGSQTYKDGYAEFSSTYRISTRLKSGAELIRLNLTNCLAEMIPGGGYATALFQVVRTDEEEKVAKLREKAFILRQDDNNVEALSVLKELASSSAVTRGDLVALSAVAEITKDYAAAAQAWAKIVETEPKKTKINAQVNEASNIFLSGNADLAIQKLTPIIDSIKAKDRPFRLPVAAMVTMGRAYLQKNDLQKAREISDILPKWKEAATDQAAIEFQGEVKVKQFEQAVQAESNKAQVWADYGRWLLDQGRFEESLEKMGKAAAIDPNLSALTADMQYAVSRLLGKNESQKQDLDALIAAAEARLGAKKESQDFYSWHNYTLLLLRKAYQGRNEQQPVPPGLGECKSALVSTLLCGRPTKESIARPSYSYMFGYYGANVVGLEGFAYPEANIDFTVLRSLRVIDKDPQNKLAHLNLAIAFVELNETDLAMSAVRTCKQIGIDCNDLLFAEALVMLQRGDKQSSKTTFQQVISKNPRHSKAQDALADLCLEAGDQPSALACMAANKTYYPKLRTDVEW